MLRRAILLICLLAAPALAGTTRIVVQWTTPVDRNSVRSALEGRAQQMGYRSGGDDIGSGTANFYLYASDQTVDGVVRHLIWMETRHELPAGMRIGVAVYKDAARSDWTYRAVYPAGLTSFDIPYRKN